MVTHMTDRFIKMGDTGSSQWFAPADTPNGDTRTFTVQLDPLSDPEPFPATATAIRFIVTASDRYPMPGPDGVGVTDGSFPVAMVEGFPSAPAPEWPTSFIIRARNSDTAHEGGSASFMWLAITEGPGVRTIPRFVSYPMNQIFVGQPAPFAATNHAGDHQFFPNAWNPATGANPLNGPALYSFNDTFGPGPFATVADEPLVFATANNSGFGDSQGAPAHNAAAVPRVGPPPVLGGPDIIPQGFQVVARNSDTAAGSCGFNWVALKQRLNDDLASGQPQPVNLMVDTGQLPLLGFQFAPAGQEGDWASAEIQFSAPFNTIPVVLITPRVRPILLGASCAPVAIAQNVTRFGFTLAARNSDSNPNVASANFDWVAFGS